MNEETKRLFLAFFLTASFLFVWTKYFGPQTPAVAPESVVAEASKETGTTASSVVTSTNSSSNPVVLSQNVSNNVKEETFGASSDKLICNFSNQAGSLSSVQLVDYTKELKKDSDKVSVVPFSQAAPTPLLWNLSFRKSQTSEEKIQLNDQNTFYTWLEKSTAQVSFSAAVSPEILVQKTYRFTKDPYVVEQVVHIQNNSKDPYYVDASTSLSSTNVKTESHKGFSFMQPHAQDIQAVAFARDKAEFMKIKNLSDPESKISDSSVSWAGFASQYFLLAAIPVEGMWNGLTGSLQGDVGSVSMNYPQRILSPNSNIEYVVKLYAGPKQIETLHAVNPTLDQSVDLGSWIGGLARGIHKLLGWIYGFIPNYGLAIIILTVLVRLAVFPLAQMQAKSMKRMTLHKPAMDALKEKFAKDREAYSRELMSYMKTNKINPASGCLPLLIQFPVFIALYRVLYNSVELRHAPFGLWIHDLSAHDPLFVLPVLVGITFFIQTKLNPTPMADPAQQTMMKIMPVIFSVFMVFLPSGLNLYIFVSTLWGIVQQYMVQKSLT